MTEPSPRPGNTRGQGHKYTFAQQILEGQEPSEWIAERRKADPDTGKVKSYAEVAEELNLLILERARGGKTIRVTHESIRRWDPDGHFVNTTDDDDQE